MDPIIVDQTQENFLSLSCNSAGQAFLRVLRPGGGSATFTDTGYSGSSIFNMWLSKTA